MLKTENQVLKNHEADIARNKNFEYTVEEERVVKIDIDSGTHTTNCLTCNRTCHHPCQIADDDQKARCAAMDFNTGKCRICPEKCHWRVHKNYLYKLGIKREMVKKTAAELRARYEAAIRKKLTTVQLKEKVKAEFDEIQTKVLTYTENVRLSLERLDEIALKPNQRSTTEYIDELIESEKAEANPGWKERIEQLREVREQAKCMKKLESLDKA